MNLRRIAEFSLSIRDVEVTVINLCALPEAEAVQNNY